MHNASAHAAFLNLTQIQSRDFGTPHLVEGFVDFYMGFRFVHTEQILGAGSSGDPALCVTWAKSGVGLGLNRNIKTSVKPRPDKNDNLQILVKATYGATRIEEDKVVSIECVQP